MPPQFSIEAASKEELAEYKKTVPTKLRLSREIGEMPWSLTAIPVFKD
jgi:hypothetical protein